MIFDENVSENIHPPKKNVATEKKFFFFHLSISLSYLEFDCKILYLSKTNILNFFMVQKFFFILKIFWVINFWTKIVYFFPISKNIISQVRIKKIFFLWKLLVALIILQKRFWKNLSSLIVFWHPVLHPDFQTKKILHFSLKS